MAAPTTPRSPEGGQTVPRISSSCLPTMLVSVDGVGPLLVVKTPAGAAQALGLALDGAAGRRSSAPIAGDDAVLVITRSERARRAVYARIGELAGLAP